MTVTGQGAWWSTPEATDPSSRPGAPPVPRWPYHCDRAVGASGDRGAHRAQPSGRFLPPAGSGHQQLRFAGAPDEFRSGTAPAEMLGDGHLRTVLAAPASHVLQSLPEILFQGRVVVDDHELHVRLAQRGLRHSPQSGFQ